MNRNNIFDSEQLIKLINTDEIKVISFDIFDTLLVRPAYSPTDVFYFLNEKAKEILNDSSIDFYFIRLTAESEARNELSKRNPNYGEITLSRIYDYIANKHNIDEAAKYKIKEAEIEIESRLLKPRGFVKKIYDLAIASGKKVILSSDFYFEKEVLEKVLKLVGIDGYEKLYVSSDLKKRKDTGELYSTIIKDEGIEPSELLHIGDNHNSDVVCALNAGVVAFQIPSNSEIFFSQEVMHHSIWEDVESYTPSEKILLGMCINKVAEDLVSGQNYLDTFSSKYMLGYYGIGAFVFSLVHHIINNEAIQKNYVNFNFSSRDGYLPQIIYDLVRNGDKKYLESKYIYSGRQAYNIAGYNGDVFKYLAGKSNHLPEYTLANLFDALVEKNFLKNKYSAEWQKNSSYNIDRKMGFVKLRAILNKYHYEIKKILDNRKKMVEDYYSSEIKLNSDNRAIIFDVGYSGSVSNGISPVINGKVDKLYLWQTPINEVSDVKNNTKSFVLCGYQDQKNERPPIFLAVEEMFSPLEKSCIGFKKNADGTIVPCFENGAEFSKGMCRSLKEIQEGAIAFTKDTIEILGNYRNYLQFNSIHKFLNPMYHAFSSVTDNSIRFLDDIVFNDNFARNDRLSLASKIEENNVNYFQRTNFLKKNLIHSSSQIKAFENNLKIGIHLHLYNVDQALLCVKHIKESPYKFDLLISVVDEKYKKIAERYFNQVTIPSSEQIIIKVFPNRGRDIAPWLVGFRQELKAYDVVCHVHTKKSDHFTWGNNWGEYLLDNLISPAAFKEIIKYFNEQKDLGIVFPPIFPEIYKFMSTNFIPHIGLNGEMQICGDLLQKMNINTTLRRDNVYFSVGNMFWYRTKALSPLFNLNLDFNNFPEEPIPVGGTIAHAIERLHSIVAEHEGYKTISYINQDELIANYHDNVMVNVLDVNDYKNKLQQTYFDLLQIYLEQGKHLDAVLFSFRIFRENSITATVQKGTLLIQERVNEKLIKDGWTLEKGKELLSGAELSIRQKNYSAAKKIINILLNYEPMNIDALKYLIDINIKEKKYFSASELNNLVLSIRPTRAAAETKKLLDKLTQTYTFNKIGAINNSVLIPETDKDIQVDNLGIPFVSIVIVTFNQYSYTKQCLDSIINHTKNNYEIIIVDNASADGTPGKILKYYPEIKLLTNSENMGFPIAANQGIKESCGKYVLLLNNDTVVTEGWLERMVSVSESDANIGIVGPVSNNVSGVQLDKNAAYKTIEEMFDYAAKLSENNKGKFFQFPRVAFLCTLIKMEVIHKIGGLDERFSPGNFEDDDYCLRAQAAGYKTVIAQDVFIHHFGSKSFTAEGLGKYQERLDTNKKIFVDKWGADPEEIWLHGKPVKTRSLEIPLDTNEASELIKRSQICIQDQEFPRALHYLDTVLNNDALTSKIPAQTLDPLYNLAGKLCLMQKLFEKAIDYYKKELKFNPQSLRAYSGLGEVYSMIGNESEAERMYEKAGERKTPAAEINK